MNVKFAVLFFVLCASLQCGMVQAKSNSDNTLRPSSKQIKFFMRQVSSGNSVRRALNGLLNRYPQNTPQLVALALSAYPEKYKEIITTAVKSQPMFVNEIMLVSNEFEVADPTKILEIVVTAEPSYAATATSTACKQNPDIFKEIIKTAVAAEPDSADQIAQKLVTTFPSQTMEILITTIKEVPYVGKYVLDALLATVTDDEERSEDMIIVSVEQLAQYPDAISRLVELANQRDIAASKIKQSAIKGGLNEEAITALIDKYYK